jgi:Ca2+-binding RTX toxin-like protein
VVARRRYARSSRRASGERPIFSPDIALCAERNTERSSSVLPGNPRLPEEDAELPRELRICPPRAALLAATAAAAALAFPGIASATVTPALVGTDLTVTSDADDAITVTCAAGAVQVNGAPVAVNCADLTSLVVQGGPGANAINLAGVTAAVFTHSPATTVTVHGNGGNDTIAGSELVDTLYGDDGNDRITGDDNAPGTRDVLLGGNDDDTLVWNPGDDDDTMDGEAGNDTIEVNGGGGGEQFTVKPSATAGRVSFDRTGPTPPGPFNLDIGTAERLDMNANGGDDTFTAENGLAGLIALDVDGGANNDILTGGDGADLIEGGDGNDTIVPGRNPEGTTDDARGGAGDDSITWNPGQGNDLNEGGEGNDVTVVNGGGGGEQFTVKPSTIAGKVRFDRTGPSPTPGPFFIEIGTSENLLLNAGAGNDEIKGFPGLAGLIKSTFNGQDGNDEIRGTDGEDLLSGGNGFDLIRANDKAADQVECDGGIDLARVDRRDTVRGCELVLGGRLRVTTAAKSLNVSGGGAALKLKCVATQRCRGVAALRRGNRTLASARFAMGKNKTQVVKLKLTAAGRRTLSRVKFGSKGLRVQLRIDAKDSRGNGWRSTANLRPPPPPPPTTLSSAG